MNRLIKGTSWRLSTSLGLRLIVYSIVAILAGGDVSRAQAPAKPSSPQYVFPSGAGVLFFHVRPERAEDFELVVKRLLQALDRSFDPTRRLQAAHWNVYKSAETPRDAVVYLFFFDPAVSGADYDPIKVLGEDAPTDVSALFERLRAAIIRVERMGLTKLR